MKERDLLNHLWSPWRMKYIQSPKSEECIFCSALKEQDGTENLILYRGKLTFLIVNRYPYTSGHLMIVPYDHQPSLENLGAETRAELIETAYQALLVLKEVYHPEAFNLGMNIGEVAGAGIADHVHMHIVPRWGGDTNFMSSIASTRVLPQSLEETYLQVREAWEQTWPR
jgi:ATP adenylyltransferase